MLQKVRAKLAADCFLKYLNLLKKTVKSTKFLDKFRHVYCILYNGTYSFFEENFCFTY